MLQTKAVVQSMRVVKTLFWRFAYVDIVVPLIAYKGNYSSYFQGLNVHFICCVLIDFMLVGVLYYSFLCLPFYYVSSGMLCIVRNETYLRGVI